MHFGVEPTIPRNPANQTFKKRVFCATVKVHQGIKKGIFRHVRVRARGVQMGIFLHRCYLNRGCGNFYRQGARFELSLVWVHGPFRSWILLGSMQAGGSLGTCGAWRHCVAYWRWYWQWTTSSRPQDMWAYLLMPPFYARFTPCGI